MSSEVDESNAKISKDPDNENDNDTDTETLDVTIDLDDADDATVEREIDSEKDTVCLHVSLNLMKKIRYAVYTYV